MSKKVYLVDTENVPSKWVSLFKNLREQDKIILFYTTNSGRYPLGVVQMCMNHRDQLVFVKCFNGHANALDFQLAAVNGYLFKEEPDAEYVVVSEDGGYDGMIRFMTGMGEKICRLRPDVNPEDVVHSSSDISVKRKKDATLSELVSEVLELRQSSPVVADIVSTIESVHAEKHLDITKVAELHNRLQKKYHRTGSLYYNALRKAGVLKKL